MAITHGLNMGQELSLLELEMRANVTKALVLSHFLGRLSGRQTLTATERLWVRYHLFEKRLFCDEELPVRQRYEDARRFAVRFLARLDRLPTSHRVSELRRWNTLPGPIKIRDLATD